MERKTRSDNYLIEAGPIVFNKDKEGEDDAVKSKNNHSKTTFFLVHQFRAH